MPAIVFLLPSQAVWKFPREKSRPQYLFRNDNVIVTFEVQANIETFQRSLKRGNNQFAVATYNLNSRWNN